MAAAHLWCVALTTVTLAAEPPAPVLYETWESVLLDGQRIGSLHTTVQEVGDGGRLRASAALDLNNLVFNTASRVRRECGTEETTDGKVFSVFMRQSQDGGRPFALTGTVEGGELRVVKQDGSRGRVRWNPDVVGLAAQERMLAERRPKPGDQFSYLRYEPTFNTVVTVRVTVKEPEAVDGASKKLLRVELTPDRIETPGASVQPPRTVVWLNEAFARVRRETELDGIGTVVLVGATRDAATAPPEKVADIGLRTLVPLSRRIARPHETRSAVFRITLRGEPAGAFARDSHQDVRDVRGDRFDLYVHPVPPPPAGSEAGPAAAEYLSPNHFIDCNDPLVRRLGARAAGGETDALARAWRIERWVFESLKPANGAALAPASEVARSLRGDCRAAAILTAALCRAEGIPSRTAVGLVYVERGGGPKLGFHMWTEVCIGGAWVGLDGTLGRGGIGACHLKIADNSWSGVRSLTPLLPATRVFGKISAEVVAVDGGR